MTNDIATAVIEHVGDFADDTVLVLSGFGDGFVKPLESLGAARVVTLRSSERPEQHCAMPSSQTGA